MGGALIPTHTRFFHVLLQNEFADDGDVNSEALRQFGVEESC